MRYKEREMPKTIEHVHWPRLLATRTKQQELAEAVKIDHIWR
jgi:hypothetical protein